MRQVVSLGTSSSQTQVSTHCPLEGDASCWTVGGVENGLWSYETLDAGVEPIAGYIGFDASKGFTVETV